MVTGIWNISIIMHDLCLYTTYMYEHKSNDTTGMFIGCIYLVSVFMIQASEDYLYLFVNQMLFIIL